MTDYANKTIQEIFLSRQGCIQAMIIFNQQTAALLMPAPNCNGKNYRIWPKLASREEAESEAKNWGSNMSQIIVAYEEMENIPDNPEAALCNFFILNFSR